MGKRVCPWWLGYLLACPLRRYLEDPVRILNGRIRQGMTVLEPGPGMGFFTLPLAQMVGPSGKVVAVDIQPKMLDRLKRRAAKAGLAERVEARLASRDSMGLADLSGSIDFTLAFAVVHEFPASKPFFVQVAYASRPGAELLLAEPAGHLTDQEFQCELHDAAEAGFAVVDRPVIRRSHAAVLRRQ